MTLLPFFSVYNSKAVKYQVTQYLPNVDNCQTTGQG